MNKTVISRSGKFLTALLILFLLPVLAFCEDPVDLVDPLIDSANSRWFFFFVGLPSVRHG